MTEILHNETREEQRVRRRLSRELALRLLYQHHASGQARPEESVRLFEQSFSPKNDPELALGVDPELFEKAWPRATRLFLGTIERLEELDAEITSASINWSLARMSLIDLNLMRLALYEMRHARVPPKVSLNEAIEIARDFGNQSSSAFVNGVLDKLMRRRREEANPA